MREYVVTTTWRFDQDFEDAFDYYESRVGPQSARRFLEEFDGFCRLVSALPAHGAPLGDSGLRWRKIGMFIAVYCVREEECDVLLLRLYHVASNWRGRSLGVDQNEE